MNREAPVGTYSCIGRPQFAPTPSLGFAGGRPTQGEPTVIGGFALRLQRTQRSIPLREARFDPA